LQSEFQTATKLLNLSSLGSDRSVVPVFVSAKIQFELLLVSVGARECSRKIALY
jgi:hypothetical protein